MTSPTLPSSLYDHQIKAVKSLNTGSVLCGGVGSGKSLTALIYYYTVVCGGAHINYNSFGYMKTPKDLYIITTAAKRDSGDWDAEAAPLNLTRSREHSISGVKIVTDSWNNIKKYTDIENAFFIFDEQRVVGSGAWVKSFLKIVKNNEWILLSATPGDTWLDYIPVFIANGFYKNRTEFVLRHVKYVNGMQYPKIERFLDISRLEYCKNKVLVLMPFEKKTIRHYKDVSCEFDLETYNEVFKKRWNIYENRPVKEGELLHTLRKVVNSDSSRLKALENIVQMHRKVVLFYNFDYERDAILKKFSNFQHNLKIGEHNGHKHDKLPDNEYWLYLVQYMSGSEGWNCVETNTIVFYSLNYSYKLMEQASGRIDRLNTPFINLFYYRLVSRSSVDIAISAALQKKKNFNEYDFLSSFQMEKNENKRPNR